MAFHHELLTLSDQESDKEILQRLVVSVDPERNIFAVFLGNRVLNRLTVLVPEEGKGLADYGLNPDGSGVFRWNDGEVIPSSVKYVHQKDEHLHKAIAKVLGLEYLPFL